MVRRVCVCVCTRSVLAFACMRAPQHRRKVNDRPGGRSKNKNKSKSSSKRNPRHFPHVRLPTSCTDGRLIEILETGDGGAARIIRNKVTSKGASFPHSYSTRRNNTTTLQLKREYIINHN